MWSYLYLFYIFDLNVVRELERFSRLRYVAVALPFQEIPVTTAKDPHSHNVDRGLVRSGKHIDELLALQPLLEAGWPYYLRSH